LDKDHPAVKAPLSDEKTREILERLLKTVKGREDMLVAMQAMTLDTICALEKGYWPMSNMAGLRRLKEYSLKLTEKAKEEGDDPTYGRHLVPPADIARAVNWFCGKCGAGSELGDNHEPDICLIREVLTQ